MRVGLFGGTFNPIHLGHLRSAEVIREAFVLDQVYFFPAAHPPHKQKGDIVPASHRLKMVELAVVDNPFFTASAVELEREGPSYSIDTIRHFRCVLQPAALFLLVGLDAFLDIHTWKDYTSILELCNVIVTSRPGIPMPPAEVLLPVALRTVFWYDPYAKIYHHISGHTLVAYEIEGLHISASAIRDKARHGKSVRYLVPHSVESYMGENALYKPGGPLR